MIDQIVPVLFKILFGFIILNIIISCTLYYIKRRPMYKLLALYWPSVLAVFFIQAFFQNGNLEVTLAGSISIFSILIFSMIGFHITGRKFPLKRYLLLHLSAYPFVFYFAKQELPFTIIALPLSLTCFIPTMHAFINLVFIDRNKTTTLQKLLGLINLLMSIHTLNFALFRMEPDAQLWGWLVAYAIYDMAAILLPAIALEEASLNEKEKLQVLVNEKTESLNMTMKENENLVRILLHDISNPLSVIKWYLAVIPKEDDERGILIERVKKSAGAIEDIVKKVKDMHNKIPSKDQLGTVSIEECFEDAAFIFNQSLEKKKLQLILKNQLPSGTKVVADKVSFTHSVLSNLISNGIKFSNPNSIIEVVAKESNGKIIIEVKDKGPGISMDVLNCLDHQELPTSTKGTMGETGSGFGLSIAKNFVTSYGGDIDFDSRPIFTNPQNHGTDVIITLNKA